MGNCQAAEAATVIIHHPANNKVERIYWSVSAHEIMTSNPGNYVALVVTSPTLKAENGAPVKQLKLLRPDDTLLIGQVYRLISFEDVLKEFAAKKSVKLGRLLRDSGGLGLELKKKTWMVRIRIRSPTTAILPRWSMRLTVSEAAVVVVVVVAAAEVWRGIMVVGGSGGQLCRALQNLGLEHMYMVHFQYSGTPVTIPTTHNKAQSLRDP
ncbi:hypothetical protein RchiOBHm_Chr2g0108341 [Rosa chinensis]|uniref:DUF4228 domain-containing protein n=1 Tax=Rosa chinensis TaxID=74649 RepID=A0A2P6RP82_ROSCH|nr:uncharacterized protein LOC112190811 [Rosa chinensis]PRQ48227.1 hypothetical protein RchiOBHm_Chr2g0108341 [Rosa chinensis]